MSFLPRSYVKNWLDKNGVRILPNGALADGAGRDRPKIAAKLYQDYIEDVSAFNTLQDKKVMRYSRTDIIEALDDLTSDRQAALRAEVVESLRCEREDLRPLSSFVRAITGGESALDVAVMAHFVWQVKRKLAGKPVTWHLMPILVGAQGGGKSTVLNQFLLSPLSYYKMDYDLENMTDTRSSKALSEHFVCLFDEMQKAQRTDMDTLKNRITAETVDYRPMRSNDLVKIKQNCTFIGTSNKAVSLMIFDPSGMRRFYQINCLRVVDWAAVRQLDYGALWRGVDETRETTYTEPVMEGLVKAQEEMRLEDDVEVFMGSEGFALESGCELEDVPVSTIYMLYRDWCEENGARALSNIVFSKKLLSLGYLIKRTKRDGKETKIISVRKQERSDRYTFPTVGSA